MRKGELEFQNAQNTENAISFFADVVMPFGLTNAPASFEREINRGLQPLLALELVINKKIDVDEDGGLVVIAYIQNILIATKGSIKESGKKWERFSIYYWRTICASKSINVTSIRPKFHSWVLSFVEN